MQEPAFQPRRSYEATFDRGAGAYRRGIASFTRATADQMLAGLPLEDRDLLVDLGTGPGPVVAAARARGIRALGVDTALGMLVQARSQVAGACWLRASGLSLPLADESADVVTAAYAFGCIAPGGSLSKELLRVLRPGGHLAFTNWIPAECVNVQILARAVERFGDPAAAPAASHPPWLFPDEEAYRSLVRSAGLAEGRIERRSLLWSMSSPYDLFESLLEINPRLQGHSPSHLASIREATAEAVRGYARGDRFAVPMGIVFGWAHRARRCD
ncbi:MAG: class I SAM-dependent methyltransferase [Myxococcota bacterium]